jgi:molybdopterin-containing oxidoreductase family membrane subunit
MVRTSARITIAAAASVLGAGCQLYVLIIGGQAYPQLLFPGKSVTSSFYDGVIADYTPSLPELMLGLGGVALAMLLLLGACRVLPFVPDPRR